MKMEQMGNKVNFQETWSLVNMAKLEDESQRFGLRRKRGWEWGMYGEGGRGEEGLGKNSVDDSGLNANNSPLRRAPWIPAKAFPFKSRFSVSTTRPMFLCPFDSGFQNPSFVSLFFYFFLKFNEIRQLNIAVW